jgi:hypothetical protein
LVGQPVRSRANSRSRYRLNAATGLSRAGMRTP